MAKTRVQDYVEKYSDQPIRFTPYALKKTGLVPSQVFLKIEDYLLICAPFQLSIQRGIFLVVLSAQEITFFQQFQKKLCTINLTFQQTGSKKPLSFLLRGTLERIGPVKGKQNVCMMDASIKACPNDLVEIIGDYLIAFDGLKKQNENFSGKAIPIDEQSAKLMRFNNYVELVLGTTRARAALSTLSVNTLSLKLAAAPPGLAEGAPCSVRMYFQVYQFTTSGTVAAIERGEGPQVNVTVSIEFTPELIEIVDDYLFRQSIQGKARVAPSAARDPVEDLARSRFGVTYLYPIQRFVMSNVLEGTPQIVVLPTGAGKSLCFQLPALLLHGPTLVLMPLLSLLSDQMRRMREAGIPVEVLRGGMSRDDKARLFGAIRAGEVRLVLATPEACMAEPNLSALTSCNFAHMVVDEAHCVSEWGESFRPAYRDVGSLARKIGVQMVSAFTATASRAVIERIKALLFENADVRLVAGGADRPGIHYSVLPVLSRGQALLQAAREAERPLLIFCRTRNGTEVAARAIRRGAPDRPVAFYHAGLTREERTSVEKWFFDSRDGALVATCAYGLGVDKPDIRSVLHADVPSSVESYLQESGRAGRDGKPSRSILLLSREEELFRARLQDPVALQRYERLLAYARQDVDCRRSHLLSLIGQDPVSCGGCDVCEGSVVREPPGQAEILWFARRHRRRFSVGQAAEVLCGGPGHRGERAFHDCVPGYASLRSWDKEEVETAIRSLLAAGSLSVPARGLWKGRLTSRRKPVDRRSPDFPDTQSTNR